jgi:hypothetical protein
MGNWMPGNWNGLSITERMAAIRNPAIEELMSLPLGWNRSVLRRAVQLMQDYATKGDRADFLPLYPLGKEIAYQLFRKVPDTMMQSA